MKKLFLLLTVFFMLSFFSLAVATTLDFNDNSELGVVLGGGMEWNSVGGGHLFMQSYVNDDIIMTLDSNTYINNFQMNYDPWEGYDISGNYSPNGWPVSIAAYNESDSLIWSTQVDLISTKGDWSKWITVSVETANVAKLVFGPTGTVYQEPGYWPSIDNMVINENLQQPPAPTPEPTTILLFGIGILGLAGVSRKKTA